jgi:aspartate kinase
VIVLKFGGTSVKDADAIRGSAEVVRSRTAQSPLVVVSALAGTTNALIGIAEQAAKGHLIGAVRNVEQLRQRHLDEVEKLLGNDSTALELSAELSAMFDELASLAEALCTLGDLTPRSLDAISALGEQLSAQVVVAAYERAGLPATHVDAREVIITDENFGKAEPQTEALASAARDVLLPLLKEGRIPVMGGFIGSSRPRNVTTTLGRGGSDYSAALVGAALRADRIEIWTDVDGMLTGDPRVVDGARLLDCVGFDEASELASFGAKVLHPLTIAPAVRLGIPVVVLNSQRPAGTGTLITFDAPRRAVTAVAGKSNISLVRVGSPRMLLAAGFMRRLFTIFERHRISVDVVATSEVSVSVTVDDATRLEAVIGDLRELGDVSIERNRGVIAVVGAGLSDGGATMARAIGALADTRIYMLSLSATGINLTVVVDADQVQPAMKRLHAEFFGGERT